MDDRRLQLFLAACLSRPVAWGLDDCLSAAASLSEIIKGRDPIAQLRGTWSSKNEAIDFEKTLGPGRIAAAIALGRRLGFPRISALEAEPGDLGLVPGELGLSSACKLPDGWFVRAERGFSIRPAAVIAWRV